MSNPDSTTKWEHGPGAPVELQRPHDKFPWQREDRDCHMFSRYYHLFSIKIEDRN